MIYTCADTKLEVNVLSLSAINATNSEVDKQEPLVLFVEQYEPLQVLSMTLSDFNSRFNPVDSSEEDSSFFKEFFGDLDFEKLTSKINKKNSKTYYILDDYVIMPDYAVGVLYVSAEFPDKLFVRNRDEFNAKFY